LWGPAVVQKYKVHQNVPFSKKKSKIFSLKKLRDNICGPHENVSPGTAVALDGPGQIHVRLCPKFLVRILMRSSDGSNCEHCVLRLSMQDYVGLMCQSAYNCTRTALATLHIYMICVKSCSVYIQCKGDIVVVDIKQHKSQFKNSNLTTQSAKFF